MGQTKPIGSEPVPLVRDETFVHVDLAGENRKAPVDIEISVPIVAPNPPPCVHHRFPPTPLLVASGRVSAAWDRMPTHGAAFAETIR